jgi:hypothetical protein
MVAELTGGRVLCVVYFFTFRERPYPVESAFGLALGNAGCRTMSRRCNIRRDGT